MSSHRLATLVRVRHARLAGRNAAGGRLAGAEGDLALAIGRHQAACGLRDELLSGARLIGRIEISTLVQLEEERVLAEHAIRAAEQARAQATQVAQVAREALGVAERELRRVERVLARTLQERRAAERRAEQHAHNDLVLFKHYLTLTEESS